MLKRLGLLATGSAVALALASAAAAQAPTPPLDAASEVEAVVVTARRIGVPVWRIDRGGSTLILIADADVPRGGTWRPEALEASIAGARSMFLPQLVRRRGAGEARGSDPFQREGTPRDLVPLEPELATRLDRVATALRIRNHRTMNLRVLGFRLLQGAVGRDRRKEDGLTIAVRAARKHRVRRAPFRGFEGLTVPETVEAARKREVRCIRSAVDLAEHAAADQRLRLAAWRAVDVPALAGSRLEAVSRDCSRLAGARYRLTQPVIEGALRDTLNQPGVTVAVLPLWTLVDQGLTLDRLSEDLPVQGPRWRAGQP